MSPRLPLNPFLLRLVALPAAILLAGSLARSQENRTTDTRVEGHVYRPQKVEPTAERVAALKVPPGFHVAPFAQLSNPRMIAVADDGTIYVTQREPGTLVMLRDADGDGVAEVQRVAARHSQLHGIAISGRVAYLAAVTQVFRADIRPDGTLGPLEVVVSDLPDAGQHPNRTLAIGPDGMLYVTVGSTCNACNESNRENATIVRLRPEGGPREVFATGLRNTIGFGWHPVSRRMFGMDHGIDFLGDDEQAEELNELVAGARYGWPYVYADGKINPQGEPPPGYTKQMWKAMSREPAALYTAHSAPMQMAFYTGTQFPEEYRGDAFVAMRGSWNRKPPSGYEVVRIRFDESGSPGGIEKFLTGFLLPGAGDGGSDAHMGRLAGIAVAKDGALLLADDTNNIVYRVSYRSGAARSLTHAVAFPRTITRALPELRGKATLKVSSGSFAPGGNIPDASSAYDANQSPEISWSGAPKGTKSFVLMMEDPDALSPRPFPHWLVANLPATATRLGAGVPAGENVQGVDGASQGAGATSELAYYGPRPPAGDTPHHYHFQVFALDARLELPSGFNRAALLAAMRGHVLASGEVVGVYQRAENAPAGTR